MSIADDSVTRRLEMLHDHYIWEVNSAVAEGRDDLIERLVDAFLRQSMHLMTEDGQRACDRPDCGVCSHQRSRPAPRRGRFGRDLLRRLLGY
jgi:hypothetical protein